MRNDEQNKKVKGIILGVVIILVIYIIPNMGIGGNKVEKVRQKIEESLLKDYGEKFEVDRIGIRSANGKKFYQARIYPKVHIEKNGTRDSYYYASASIDIGTFGKLEEVADDYIDKKISEELEEYLLPKVEGLFGKKVRLKGQMKYEMKQENGDWGWYSLRSFKKMLKETIKNPESKRLELTLYIYIFDKIDNEEEKEKRRREIFEYIGYLKKEGLFEYLEMGVIFIDERVLTPSYKKYEGEIFITKKDEVEVEGKTVYLPPMKLRKEMSKVLGEELKEMSEDKVINNMDMIRKSDLRGFENLKYNLQCYCILTSIEMMKIQPYGEYEKEKEKNKLNIHQYNKINNIEIIENSEYIYINKNEGEDKNE